MPVWGMWDDSTLWFTPAPSASRKMKNLRADPNCCDHHRGASDPVIIEGQATMVRTEPARAAAVIDLMNAKYATHMSELPRPGGERDVRGAAAPGVRHAGRGFHRIAHPLDL